MSRILFSPIGGSDPIRNFRDGSMLHICRNYMPDKVYLYLTHEMCEYHEKDNRYIYCLERLGKLINHNFEVKIIKRDDLVDVQDHEIFYEEFRKCIIEIEQTMQNEDELLINISSGTPAMKNALVILTTLAEFPFKPIQVSTPLKKHNNTDENIDKYDVEGQWECNEDNELKRESRCTEVQSTNLLTLLKVNIIKQHLRAYNYSAAYQIANDMKQQLEEECLLYIEQALERTRLNNRKVNEIARKINYNPMPVRKDGERELVEYLLALKLKECRETYDDFIRGITPVVVVLLEAVIKKQCHINITEYYKVKSGQYLWDKSKLNQTEEGQKIKEVLQEKYNNNFKFSNVYSVHLKYILLNFSNNNGINKLAEELRFVEENARNKAAHTMNSITQEMIKKWTGFDTKEIFAKMRELACFVGIDSGNDVWNSYDIMNEKMINILDENIRF